jgi:hypothetical protein
MPPFQRFASVAEYQAGLGASRLRPAAIPAPVLRARAIAARRARPPLSMHARDFESRQLDRAVDALRERTRLQDMWVAIRLRQPPPGWFEVQSSVLP